MKSIFYLVRCQLKNSLRQLLRHPAQLISYLLVIALILFSFVLNGANEQALPTQPDLRLLQDLYFFALLVALMLILRSGIKSGSTFFTMPDVNLLFVSPVRPNQILCYGLVKQMTSMALMVVLLMLYAPMLMGMFSLSVLQVFLLVIGLAFLLVLAQILSMLMYNASNGNPTRRRAFSAVLYAASALPVLYAGIGALQSDNVYQGLLNAAASPVLNVFPVAGWIRGAVFGVFTGDFMQLGIYVALLLALTVAGVILLVRGNPDYYEDVLQSTEVAYERAEEIKENPQGSGMEQFSRRKFKKKGGFHHGWGASTFFYRQLCEIRRKSRLGFITTSTVLIVLIGFGMAVFMQRAKGDPMDAESIFQSIMITQIYLLYFFQVTGDWITELKKPYVYLVPASSFSKLIWTSVTTLAKPLIDGFLAFTVLWLYLRVNPAVWLCAIVMYVCFGFLFTATNILFFRWLGKVATKGFLALLQLIVLLILMIPGLVLLLVAFVLVQLPWYLAGLAFAFGNALVAVGIYAACRNVLDAPDVAG